MKDKVIHPKNMYTRLPVLTTAVAWLLLDRLNAPQWVWGAVGVVLAAFWLGSIVRFFGQELTDIFKEKD